MTDARCAIVLGGGVAGIHASLLLRERGWNVELRESRRGLGGRVFSFDDRLTRETLDNGPHVMMGCYDEMRALLRRLGTEDQFAVAASLRMAYRAVGGAHSAMALSRLPTPLALPIALLRIATLRGHRLRACRGAVAVLRGAPANWSVADWLRARGQQGPPDAHLWRPMCLAIMNAEPDDVSAALFLGTLRRAFSGRASRAAMWLPQRPWSEIVGEPARRVLEQAGVTVLCGDRVTALEYRGDRVAAIVHGSGTRREIADVDIVVSALPWHRLGALLPAAEAAWAGDFSGRSIVNLYFDFGDRAVIPDDGPLVTLVGGEPFQFVYRRPGAAPGSFALIAGAAEALDGLSVGEIARRGREQIGRHYPGVVWPEGGDRVTREGNATLLADPAGHANRPPPGPHPRLHNLLVCGDWTQTDLPSTLEGAAASAARLVLGLR